MGTAVEALAVVVAVVVQDQVGAPHWHAGAQPTAGGPGVEAGCCTSPVFQPADIPGFAVRLYVALTATKKRQHSQATCRSQLRTSPGRFRGGGDASVMEAKAHPHLSWGLCLG